MVWLLLILFRIAISEKSFLETRKFSGLYHDLNAYLEEYGRKISWQEAQSKYICTRNKECQEEFENSICDQFYVKNETRTSNGEFHYNGSYCVRKPIFENHIGLVADPDGLGPRRCLNYRFCGRDEMCLLLNSRSFDDGFCVKLKVCSRNRDASRDTELVIPGHRWDCFSFSVSKPFSLLYFENGREHRSRRVHTCCSEPVGGKCIHGNTTYPLKSCFEHSDCFSQPHESMEWCDETTKICCSDQSNDKSIQCPDGSTYPFIEPKCDFYNENVPLSGSCSVNSEATCLHGHCCPSVEMESKTNFTYKTTYETSIPCDPLQPIRRVSWSFCDNLTRKIIVLSSESYEELTEAGENECENNNHCKTIGSVCAWGSGNSGKGICIQNPVIILSYSQTLSYSLLGCSIAFILTFSILTTVFRRIIE